MASVTVQKGRSCSVRYNETLYEDLDPLVRALCVRNDTNAVAKVVSGDNVNLVYGGKSMVTWALLYRNLSSLDVLISAGADLVKAENKDLGGAGLLATAIVDKTPSHILTSLLRQNPKDLLNHRNKDGWTGLEVALHTKSALIYDLEEYVRRDNLEEEDPLNLFFAVSDDDVPNAASFLSRTAVSSDDLGRALWMCCSSPMQTLLLKHGARVDVRDVQGNTLLMEPSPMFAQSMIDYQTRLNATFAMLSKQHDAIDAKDHNGRTPLIRAVCMGMVHVVFRLLMLGAHPYVKDEDGLDAFDYAYGLTRCEITISMLENWEQMQELPGAGVTSGDDSFEDLALRSQSIPMMALRSDKAMQYRAFWCGEPEQVERLCLTVGNEVTRAVSSFMCFLAIREGRKALAELLLSYGADPFRPVFTGDIGNSSSAFLACCVGGSPDLLKVVLQHSQGQIDNVAYHGHAFCEVSDVITLRALMKAGVDVFGVNREGKNALNVLMSSRINDSEFANELVSAFDKSGCYVRDKWGWSAADIALSKRQLPDAIREQFFSTAELPPDSPVRLFWNNFKADTLLLNEEALVKLLDEHQILQDHLLVLFAHACYTNRKSLVQMLITFVGDQLAGVHHYTGKAALDLVAGNMDGDDYSEGGELILEWILTKQIAWNVSVGGKLLYTKVLEMCSNAKFYEGLLDAVAVIPNLVSTRFWIEDEQRVHTLMSWACRRSVSRPIFYFCRKANRDWDVSIGGLSVFEQALLNQSDSWQPARLIESLSELDFEDEQALMLFENLKADNFQSTQRRAKLTRLLISDEHADTRRVTLAKACLLTHSKEAQAVLSDLFKLGEDLLEPMQLASWISSTNSVFVIPRLYRASELIETRNLSLGAYSFQSLDLFADAVKMGYAMDYASYFLLRQKPTASLTVPGFIRIPFGFPCCLNQEEEPIALPNDNLQPELELATVLKQRNGEVPVVELPERHRLRDLLFCAAAKDGNMSLLTAVLDLGYIPPIDLLNHSWRPTVVSFLLERLKHLLSLESPGFLQRRLAEACEDSNREAVETILDVIDEKNYKIKFNRTAASGNMLLTAVMEALEEGEPDAVDIARMLLLKGADPSTPDPTRQGYSALDRAYLREASSTIEVSVMKLMAEHTQNHPRAQLQEKIWASLATGESEKLILSYVQDSKGIDLEPRKFLGRVLHVAVAQTPRMANHLLDAGADVTTKDLEGNLLVDVLVASGRVDLFSQFLEKSESWTTNTWKNIVVATIPKLPFLQLTLKSMGTNARHVMEYSPQQYLSAGLTVESLELLFYAGLNPKLSLHGSPFLTRLLQSEPKEGMVEAAIKRGADPTHINTLGEIPLMLAFNNNSLPLEELALLVPHWDEIDDVLALRERQFGWGIFHLMPRFITRGRSYNELNLYGKRFDCIMEEFQKHPSSLGKYLQARCFFGRTPVHDVLSAMADLKRSNKLKPVILFEKKWSMLTNVLLTYGQFVDSSINRSSNEEIVTVPDTDGNTILTSAIETGMYDFLSLSFIYDYVDRVLWQKVVRKNFLREAALYTLFTILYTAVGIMEERRGHTTYSTSVDILSLITQISVVLLAIYFSVLEIIEFRYRGRTVVSLSHVLAVLPQKLQEKIVSKTTRVPEYLLDWSNAVDGGMIVLFFISVLLRLANILCGNDGATYTERILFGLNGIIVWFRILSYLRQAPKMGPLLHMIEEMVRDVVNFMFLFFVFLFAFTTAFFWVNYPLPGEEDGLGHFSSYFGTLLWLLEVFFGNFEFDGHDNQNIVVNRLLFLLYLVMAFILLLNLLIAMMSSSYSRVENKATKLFKMDRVSLCLKYSKLHTTKEEKRAKIDAGRKLRYLAKITVSEKVAAILKRQERDQQSQLIVDEDQSKVDKLDSTIENLEDMKSLMSKEWKVRADEK